MAVEVDPGIAEQLVERVRFWAGNFEAYIGQHPELTTVPPAAAGGWSLAVAAGAYFLGAISGTPTDLNQRRFLEWLPGALDLLKQPSLPRIQAANLIESVRFWSTVAEREWGAGPPPDLSTLVPSPNAVQRASGQALATSVARLTAWEHQHHGKVHVPLARAEAEQSAALHPFTAAVADLGTATVQGFRAVVNHLLPEVRTELTTLIREERSLRRDADTELRGRLIERTTALAQRIGDLVRWLRTEALPDLAEAIQAEQAARTKGDRALTRGLATETDARTGADAELQAALAPLVAWAGAFGVHTTTKVKNVEDPLDRLMGLDPSSLLLFAGFPALVELITRLLPRVAEATPAVLSGLEGAAVRALGDL